MAAGLGFAGLAFHISWASVLWFLPIAVALMLSPLVSWGTGLPSFGRWLWRMNVFRIPEEEPALQEPEGLAEEGFLQAAE